MSLGPYKWLPYLKYLPIIILMATPLMPSQIKLVELPQQKLYGGVPFPLVLSPATGADAGSLLELVRGHKPWLEAQLKEAKAVLFRGFDVPAAADFAAAVAEFGYPEFPFKGVAAPRSHVVGPVYTANDSPPHFPVPFHNEIAYLKDHLRKAFFYCEVEPRSHGETPIVLGRLVYERLKKNHRDFLHSLEEHGFVYHKFLPDETDQLCPIGQSWKTTFSTHDKSIAKQRAEELGLKLEWVRNGVMVEGEPVAGIKVDDKCKIWFNAIMVISRSDKGYVTLGDGGPVSYEFTEECGAILEEESVAFPWSHGDILMFDNWAVQHARRPFTLPRRVLVAFTK